MKKLVAMASLMAVLVFGGASTTSAQYYCVPGSQAPTGRVLTSIGRGVSNVKVTITTVSLGHPSNVEPSVRYAYTNTLGFYTMYSPYDLCDVSEYVIQAYSPRYGYTNAIIYVEQGQGTIPTIYFP